MLSGDVILRRLQLKPEALEKLNLPVELTRGVVGSLRLKIPWAKLGKEPVVVTISEVFASARQLSAEEVAKRAKKRKDEDKKLDDAAVENAKEEGEEDSKKRNEEKVERLDNAERLWLMKRLFDLTLQKDEGAGEFGEGEQSDSDGGFVQKYAKIILGNLQISIENVHIRYEDEITTPNHAFAAGLTIRNVSAHTVDENGNPDFVRSASFAEFRKKLTLDGFSIYFDSEEGEENTSNSNITSSYSEPKRVPNVFFTEKLDPNAKDMQQWLNMFMPAFRDEDDEEKKNDVLRYNRILQPISGSFIYTKRADKRFDDGETPRQLMECHVDTAGIRLKRAQYHNIARVLEAFKIHQLRSETEHLRPNLFGGETPRTHPQLWWKYAILAAQTKIRKRRQRTFASAVKWEDIVDLSRKRRRFLTIYNQPGGADDDDLLDEIYEIDSKLSYHAAMTFRCIAHLERERMNDTNSNSIALAAVHDAKRYYEKEILPHKKKGKISAWFGSYFSSSSGISDDSSRNNALKEGVEKHVGNDSLGQLFSDDDFTKLEEVFDVKTIESQQKSAESSWKGKDLSFSVHIAKMFVAITENNNRDIISSVALDLTASRNVYKNGNATSFLNILGWVVDANGTKMLQSGIDRNTENITSSSTTSSDGALSVSYEEYPPFDMEFYDSKTVVIAAPTFLVIEKNFIDSIAGFFEKPVSDELTSEVLEDFAEDIANVTSNVAKRTASGLSSVLNRMKFEISIDAPKIALLPSTEGNMISCDKKIVLDLGKFVVSNDPQRDQGSANRGIRGDPKYNAFTVNAENLAAYIASGTFDVQGKHEILLQRAKENRLEYDLEAYFVLAPLKITLDLQIAGSGFEIFDEVKNNAASSDEQNPGMIAEADISDLAFTLSPCRLAMMYNIVNSFTKSQRYNGKGQAPDAERVTINPRLDDGSSTKLSTISKGREGNKMSRIISSRISVDISRASIALWGQKMGCKDEDNVLDGVIFGGVERLSKFECAKSEFAIIEIVATGAKTIKTLSNVDESYVIEAGKLEIHDVISGGYFIQLSNSPKNIESASVKMRYDSWTSTESPTFKNCYGQLEVSSDICFLGVRRPTIASVSRFYDELSLVLSSNKASPSESEVENSNGSGHDTPLKVVNDENEYVEEDVPVNFRLAVRFKELSLTTFVEAQDIGKNGNNPAVASIEIHDADISLLTQTGLNPMKVFGTLGSLSVMNETLPESHPHRYFVSVKKKENAALDSDGGEKSYFEYLTFDRSHRNFPGHEQHLLLNLKKSKVTFLMRFFSQLLCSVGGLLADAIPIDKLPEKQRNAEILRRGITRPSTFKYDVSLSQAEIVLPKSTSSQEALRLDAKNVSIGNSLEWKYGDSHLTRGAVLMNRMSIQLKDFAMFIKNGKGECGSYPALFCAKGERNDPAQTFSLDLISPSWDPTEKMCASDIRLGADGAITLELDDVEYNILLAVLSGNFSETGFLQEPLFEYAEIEVPKENDVAEGEIDTLPSLKSMITVNLPEVCLSMFNSPRLNAKISPLARLVLRRLWVCYETLRNDEEAYSVHLSLPALSVQDVRNGTAPAAAEIVDHTDESLTLLTLDLISRADKFDLGVNLQSCRLKVDPQFLREVLYFFNLKDDELRRQMLERRLKNDINFLNKDFISLASQNADEVDDAEIIMLSPAKRILCDGLHAPPRCTLDGNGRKIVLPCSLTKHLPPLICVGNFRRLTIRNAVIEGDVESFLSLGTRSSIIYENVTFEKRKEDGPITSEFSKASANKELEKSNATDCVTTCSVLARNVELLILDSDTTMKRGKTVSVTTPGTNALSVQLYASVDYKSMPSELLSSNTRTELNAVVNGVTINLCRSTTFPTKTKFVPKVSFLEPTDFDVKLVTDANGYQVRLISSDMCSSFDSVSLRVAKNCLSQLSNVFEKKVALSTLVSTCNSYVPISASRYTNLKFWRPVPPKGFSFLGDVCLSTDADAPASPVMSINDAADVTTLPIGFSLVWSSPSNDCFIWAPVPPSEDYVSLGCIATESESTPDVAKVGCKVVRREVVKECEILDCVYDGGEDQLKLWRLENSCGTFVLSEKKESARSRCAAQLRIPLLPEVFIEKTRESTTQEVVSVSESVGAGRTIKPRDETSVQVSLPRIALTLCEPGKRDPFISLGINDVAVVVRGNEENAENNASRDGSASTKIDVAFFNPRVASWEPLIEPFDVCARFDRSPIMTDNIYSEDSVKFSVANAIGVNISSSLGDAIVKYQRADQKLLSPEIIPSSESAPPLSSRWKQTLRGISISDDEINLSNSISPLLKNELRRSIYVRYQRSTKDDVVEVKPQKCITLDSLTATGTKIVPTLDKNLEPPDSRFRNGATDGYLDPNISPYAHGRVKTLQLQSTFVLTFTKCRIEIGAHNRDLVDVSESALYARINVDENLMRTRASALLKVTSSSSSMDDSVLECIWSDKFIARVASEKIHNCSVSISVIDAHGNGGRGKVISFLNDMTMSHLINMYGRPSDSNTIKLPNDVEIQVAFEGYGSHRTSGGESDAQKSLLSSKTEQIYSIDSKAGFATSVLPRKNSEDVSSSAPLYYLSLHPKGPWTKLVCEELTLSESSDAIDLSEFLNYSDAAMSNYCGEKDVLKAVVARTIDPITQRIERTIRELSRVRNETDRSIEIFVVPARMTPEKTEFLEKKANNDDRKSWECNSIESSVNDQAHSGKVRRVVEEAFENERFLPFRGWRSTHLLLTERKAWSTRTGSNSMSSKEDFLSAIESNKPANWTWEEDEWEIDTSHPHCDEDGFAYAGSFPELKYPFRRGQEIKSTLSFVRMRRWIRTRRYVVPFGAQSKDSDRMSSINEESFLDDVNHHVTYRTIIEAGCEKSLPSAVLGPDASSHVYFRVLGTDNASYGESFSSWAKPVKSGFFDENFDDRLNSESSTIEDAMLKRAIKRGGLALADGVEESAVHVCEDVDGLKGKNWFVSVRCERFPLGNSTSTSRKPSRKTNTDSQRAVALSSEWIVTLSAPWCLKNALPVTAEISLNSYAQQRENEAYFFEKKYSKILGPGEIAKTYYVDPGAKCIARVESISGGWEPSQRIDYGTPLDKNFDYFNYGVPVSPASCEDAAKKKKDSSILNSGGSFTFGTEFTDSFSGGSSAKSRVKSLDAFEVVKVSPSSKSTSGNKISMKSSVKITCSKLDETDVASTRVLILCSPLVLINRTGDDIVFRSSAIPAGVNQNKKIETSSNPSMSDVAMSLIDDTSEMQIGDENSDGVSSRRLSSQTTYIGKTLPTNNSDMSEVYVLKGGTGGRPEDRITFLGAESANELHEKTAARLVSKNERLEIGCSKKSLSEPLPIADRDFISERIVVVECLTRDGQTCYPISIRSEEQPHLANIGDGLEHTRGMFTECLAIILEPAFSLINNTGETIHLTQVDPNKELVFDEKKDVITLHSKRENKRGVPLRWSDTNLPRVLYAKRERDEEWMIPFVLKSTHTGDTLLPINKRDADSLEDVDDFLHVHIAKTELTRGSSRVHFSSRVGNDVLEEQALGSPPSKEVKLKKKMQLDQEASKREKSISFEKNNIVSRKVFLSIPEFVLSTIDSNVEEIFVVTLNGIDLEYNQALVGASAASIRFVLHSLQIDDMSPLTQYPVLLRVMHDAKELVVPPMLNFVVRSHLETDGKTSAYEEILINFSNAPIHIAAYEPSLWRALEFYDHFVDGSKQSIVSPAAEDKASQQADPQIFIELMKISKLRIVISFRASEQKRPKRVRKVFPGIVTVVNLDEATLDLRPMRLEKQCAKKSTFQDTLTKAYVKQVKLQIIRLLTGFDALDSVALALNRASIGLSKLSGGRTLDLFGVSQEGKKPTMLSSALREKLFIGSKDIRNDALVDESTNSAVKTGAAVVGLMDGTETLARGVLSGVTGVFMQPVKGAMKSGTKGFVKGFGKGLVGAVAQPVSGAVGMISHVAAGASGGVREAKELVGLSHGAQFAKRIRPARAPSADGILRPFSKELLNCEKLWRAVSGSKAKIISRRAFGNEHFAWQINVGRNMDISQILGADEKNKNLPANAHFTLFSTNYRLMLMMTDSNSTRSLDNKTRKNVTLICWDISWCNIEMAYIKSAEENKRVGDALCIKLKRPSLLERQIKSKAKRLKREKKMRQKRPERFLFREDDLTRLVPLGKQTAGDGDVESFHRWVCDQILLHSRTFGKVYIVSRGKDGPDTSKERRRLDTLSEGSSESESDLVLFSDSDSLSAQRIFRDGGDFTSESEDLDGDFDEDDFDEDLKEDGEESQKHGLDWELEEDRNLLK